MPLELVGCYISMHGTSEGLGSLNFHFPFVKVYVNCQMLEHLQHIILASNCFEAYNVVSQLPAPATSFLVG